MNFNWETFLLALIQVTPGLISSIVTPLKGSPATVHSQAVQSAAIGMASLAGATPEQAQAAGTLAAAIHAQTVILQAAAATAKA
jgi:hypothetical protein